MKAAQISTHGGECIECALMRVLIPSRTISRAKAFRSSGSFVRIKALPDKETKGTWQPYIQKCAAAAQKLNTMHGTCSLGRETSFAKVLILLWTVSWTVLTLAWMAASSSFSVVGVDRTTLCAAPATWGVRPLSSKRDGNHT